MLLVSDKLGVVVSEGVLVELEVVEALEVEV